MEILILRVGLLMACVGLLDTDTGVFKTYIQIFLVNLDDSSPDSTSQDWNSDYAKYPCILRNSCFNACY